MLSEKTNTKNCLIVIMKYALYQIIKIFLPVFLGINIFLDGFVPTENLRFREVSLTFKVAETAMEEEIKRTCRYEYPMMIKKLGMI